MIRASLLVVGAILLGAGMLTWRVPPPRPRHGVAIASASVAPAVREAPIAGPRLAPNETREEVALIRRDFLAPSRSFSDTARAEAESRLVKLEETKVDVSVASFGLEACRIAALADDGHTACNLWNLAGKYPAVPWNLAPLGNGIYVIGTTAENEDLLGARLVGVEGQPIDAVKDMAASLRGGTASYRALALLPVVYTPALLHALGIAHSPDAVTYQFATRDGHAIERSLSAAPPPAEWRWLVPQERTPWAWQKLDEPFRLRDAPELDAVIVQLRRNNNFAGRSLAEFLRSADVEIKKRKRRNIVVDLRFDDGGDLTKTRDFMVGLPARVGRHKGHVFALLGPRTFSAGISSAAYLKQAGGKRVVLVGEPPGDRMVFFAEGPTVVLPHSQLELTAATARHDYHDACRAFDDCFVGVAQPGKHTGSPAKLEGLVARHPIAIASLEPDVPASFTLDAFMSGHDPALDAIAPMILPKKRAARP
jgi:hypothetical protein